MAAELSPQILTVIQQQGIKELAQSFSHFQQVATYLFALVATIELGLFGLFWALRQDGNFADLIIKVFKLGLIFFVISSYPYLLKSLVGGFSQMAQHHSQTTISWLFDPSKLWQFGFAGPVSLLKLAVYYGTANVGMSMIYLVLGFALIIGFSLIGALIILTVLSFYIISLLALLLIPLGSVAVARDLFHKALQAVIQAGARIFGLLMVLALAIPIWQQFKVTDWGQATALIEPLGLLTTVIVFAVLTIKIPALCAQAVGSFSSQVLGNQGSSVQLAASSGGSTMTGNMSDLQAATTIVPTAAASTTNVTQAATPPMAAASSVVTTNTGNWASSGPAHTGSDKLTAAANKLAKTQAAGGLKHPPISKKTLSRLQASFRRDN